MSTGWTGSTNLNEEQRAFYTKKFGDRYVAVEQMPYTMTRAERRKAKFRPRADR